MGVGARQEGTFEFEEVYVYTTQPPPRGGGAEVGGAGQVFCGAAGGGGENGSECVEYGGVVQGVGSGEGKE